MLVATEISERIKAELGCTVSIGISWNKIFAKFGSDWRKPDAVTPITRSNYREIVWTAPVEKLLYVGSAAKRTLNGYAILTIGDLAHAPDAYLSRRFGVTGATLKTFAQGKDITEVKAYDPEARGVNRTIKSYGNGLTAPHDITTARDAKALLTILCESVAQRMRENRVRAKCVGIGVRYGDDLTGYTRQTQLAHTSATTRAIAKAAWSLLSAPGRFESGCQPIRALHVRASALEMMADDVQLRLFDTGDTEMERLDYALDDLRRRYGNTIVRRGIEMADQTIDGLDIKAENTVHPVGYFHR